MKAIKASIFVLPFLALFYACGGGSGDTGQIAGTWNLTGFSDKGTVVELTDCDKQTTWNFTEEADEPLGDGTKVMKLKASAPDNCEYYGFDAKWTLKDGQLFISTSRIGGMGGNSLAGMMKIVEQSPNKMVLETLGKQLTLER